MTLTFEELQEGVSSSTKSGGWTQYAVWDSGGKQPSPGKKGVKTPFPSGNFKLTTDEHQLEVRRVVEAAGYDFYVPG